MSTKDTEFDYDDKAMEILHSIFREEAEVEAAARFEAQGIMCNSRKRSPTLFEWCTEVSCIEEEKVAELDPEVQKIFLDYIERLNRTMDEEEGDEFDEFEFSDSDLD